MSEETGAMSEKALHILRAAVNDAGDEPGVYVSRARVMEQTDVSDLEEFERIAEGLAERGFKRRGQPLRVFRSHAQGHRCRCHRGHRSPARSHPESLEARVTVPEGEVSRVDILSNL